MVCRSNMDNRAEWICIAFRVWRVAKLLLIHMLWIPSRQPVLHVLPQLMSPRDVFMVRFHLSCYSSLVEDERKVEPLCKVEPLFIVDVGLFITKIYEVHHVRENEEVLDKNVTTDKVLPMNVNQKVQNDMMDKKRMRRTMYLQR